MFTGIIEELGTIRGVSLTKDGGELQIAATTVLGGTKLGDSIAVNGTCLTVTKLVWASSPTPADIQPF